MIKLPMPESDLHRKSEGTLMRRLIQRTNVTVAIPFNRSGLNRARKYLCQNTRLPQSEAEETLRHRETEE